MKRMFVMCLLSVCISLSIFARGNTESAGTIQQGTEAVETQWNRGEVPPDFQGEGRMFGGGMMQGGDGTAPVNTSSSNVSTRSIIDDRSDNVESVTFKRIVSVDVEANTSDADGKEVSVSFTENGLEIISLLTEPVKVVLSGSMKGTISIEKSEGDIALVLNNLTVIAADGPALVSNSTHKTYVVLEKGSKNILADSKERDVNTKKGAVYSKGSLIFSGGGSLSVDASYKNGIYSDDYISVKSGTIAVSVSARDAVRSINGFIMSGGNLSITGTGSVTDEESKGIKVDGEENEKRAGEGFIVISGGTINISTVGKAVTAAWEKEEDAETDTTSDDPNSYVKITGGIISIKTTGKPYEYETEEGVTVSCSPEGIEAKTDLIVSGGTIKVETADDCLNAGISIQIAGGSLEVKSSGNDAIDSNGALTISGGNINAQGGRSPETAFDSDMYPFTITGGTVFGTGGTNMSYPVDSENSQNTLIVFSTLDNGKELRILDSNNKEIFSADIDSWLGSAVISSPAFQKGQTYTLYNGDTKITSFTIENSTTTIGQSTEQGFGGRGGFPGGEMGTPPADGNFKGGKRGMAPPDGSNPVQK
ncbi:MAG: carbohydrate-binding domain-containing protein [Spirochaetaceae bacterium]|nr:carbohydrate-binding domain-containing protein [Spirochaetaceae bacterium]